MTDYNCFRFLCFINLGGSTITKTFAAHDCTDTQQQNLCQMQLKLQETPKCPALHNIVQIQDAVIAILVVWLLSGFFFQHCRDTVLLLL